MFDHFLRQFWGQVEAQRSFGRQLWRHGGTLEAPGVPLGSLLGDLGCLRGPSWVHFSSLGVALGALGTILGLPKGYRQGIHDRKHLSGPLFGV